MEGWKLVKGRHITLSEECSHVLIDLSGPAVADSRPSTGSGKTALRQRHGDGQGRDRLWQVDHNPSFSHRPWLQEGSHHSAQKTALPSDLSQDFLSLRARSCGLLSE